MMGGHPSLGKLEQRGHIGDKVAGFVDREQLNGVVQEAKVRLVACVSFHLADRLLLVLSVHRAQGLLVSWRSFGCSWTQAYGPSNANQW